MAAGKRRSVVLLALAAVLSMSLWFVSAAILPEIVAEGGLGPGRAAALSSAVQIGFVIGALALAVHGTADRHDPRRVILVSALIAAAANLALLVTPLGGGAQIGAAGADRRRAGRGLSGGDEGAGRLGHARPRRAGRALRRGADGGLGAAAPPRLPRRAGLAGDGGGDLGAGGGWAALLGAAAGLGPHHARSARFDPGALRLAWTDRRVRLAYAGYLGHMWELYAFWAWIGAAAGRLLRAQARRGRAAGGAARRPSPRSRSAACSASRRGGSPTGSARRGWRSSPCRSAAAAGLATALAFGGPVWLVAALVLLWGAAVIPDSAQFSALVADAAPASPCREPPRAADGAGLHPHLLHGAGGAAGGRRPRLAGHARAPRARSRRGHRGDAPADPPDGQSGRRPDPILARSHPTLPGRRAAVRRFAHGHNHSDYPRREAPRLRRVECRFSPRRLLLPQVLGRRSPTPRR